MPIVVTCNCGKSYHAPDTLQGKRVKCPACGGVVTVPMAAAAPGPRGPPPRRQPPRPMPTIPWDWAVSAPARLMARRTTARRTTVGSPRQRRPMADTAAESPPLTAHRPDTRRRPATHLPAMHRGRRVPEVTPR